MNFKPKKIKERLEAIKTDPEKAVKFISEHLPGTRWPEAEKYIMKDTDWASYYAVKVIKGPWPEAEPYILQYLPGAVFYAAYARKKLWPELEEALDDYSKRHLRKHYNDLMKYYTY
jgi:hypothetical protein